ncbi:hypothetical protein SESBI_03056 [Sesbania bispinosa]|nr:hypothetical protein SESBI_03056 [Sesbania bispinosa]
MFRENHGKEGFDAGITVCEEFPKQLPRDTLEESGGLTVPKMQETIDVKEEMVKRKGKEIEYIVEKGEGERPKRMHVEAKKGMTKETMQKEIERIKSGIKNRVGELDGSKGSRLQGRKELNEVIKEAMAETESLMEKVELEGEESKKRIEGSKQVGDVQRKASQACGEGNSPNQKDKIEYGTEKLKGEGSVKKHVEPNEVFEEDTTGDRIGKDIRKHKLDSSDQLRRKGNVDNGRFDGSKRQKFPQKGETEGLKEEGVKSEQSGKKVNEDKNEKIQLEENGGIRKDITRDPKTQTKEKEQHRFQEEMSTGRFQGSKAAKEEFPTKMSEEKMENKEEVKEEGAEIAQVKKVEGEKYEKIQVEASGLKDDITKETTLKETEEPKIPIKEKDQQCLQEEMGKGRYKASTTPREFPMQIVDSLSKTRGEPKDKELEEEKEVKKELVKQKSEERMENKDVKEEGDNMERTEEPKIPIKKNDQHCLQEEMSEGRYESSTTARDFPMKIVDSPSKTRGEPKDKELEEEKEVKEEVAKRNSEETKVVESTTKGGEKEKEQKTELLPPKIQSKETHESKNGSVDQGILKPEKATDVGEGEEYTYDTKSNKEVPSKEDQVANHSQQYVPRDVGKGIGKAEIIGKEIPKEEYVADAGPIAERMETKGDLKAPLEREEYITQNVKDGKPRIQEEILQADIEKVDKSKCIPESLKTTQEKEYPIKSEAVEEEAESLEPISSIPNVTNEENRKSENVVEAHETAKELPKKNIVANEEIDSFQPQVVKNQCFEEEQKVDRQKEAHGQRGFKEINQEKSKGPRILIEDRGQHYVQENNEKIGYQTTEAAEEELLKQEHGEEIVLKKREGSKVEKREEAKEASRQLLKRERGKKTQTAEEKKPKMKEITPEVENASGFKQVVVKMHETQEREPERESEVTSQSGMEPPTTVEITPNKGIERKEPRELSWPSMDYEIPKIDEVQQEKEGERPIHTLEATTSKEKGLGQAAATHSKAKTNVELEPKGDTDKPQVNKLPSPGIETLSNEPCELDKFSMKEDDSKVENSVQVRKGKESIQSIKGTTASEVVVADKAAQPSKFPSSSSTQQFEVEAKDKTNADHEVENAETQETKKKDSKIDVQESTKIKTGKEVEQVETPQPDSSADQQCINKEQEENHGTNEIEEKSNEQVLEEQKESKEEASGGKKDDTKLSKKLLVPLVIAGSAFLVSLVVIFVRIEELKKALQGNTQGELKFTLHINFELKQITMKSVRWLVCSVHYRLGMLLKLKAAILISAL